MEHKKHNRAEYCIDYNYHDWWIKRESHRDKAEALAAIIKLRADNPAIKYRLIQKIEEEIA